ncbi:PhzF family phenazine biosynthesis protein [Actinocrinis puniceicyclus]|uniref:PhzF family phenazine biosynthesis protein n=1 Tax=Actinocrinis puniceicyclus TaxID=977794 RepID=A0A8J7WPH2_9ACTN|nr:PhzF family phenazine biosynthesis protein [Actinocrinis puniceicyclus]MBS2963154.1 PhzF family phenazine biosynthesis protein [Actinocrinis puniceicyclus]
MIALTETLDVQVLRVFADRAGGHGNELAVVFDAARLPAESGIRLTALLGFSESVFVDDEPRAGFRIFTPAAELRLAGHPTVGVAWVLGERAGGAVPEVLRPRLAAPVAAWREQDEGDSVVWFRGAIADTPPWRFVRLDDPAEVDALEVEAAGQRAHHQFWAWLDEAAGLVRARTFAGDVAVPEDEATGSAAIRLADLLRRPITVRQGRGSVLHARPAAEPGWAEVGGRVVSDGWRRVTL